MDVSLSYMIDDSRARLHQPRDDSFNGPARVSAPQIEPADQMNQIVCKKIHFHPGFVRRKPVATCLVPAEHVLPFLIQVR